MPRANTMEYFFRHANGPFCILKGTQECDFFVGFDFEFYTVSLLQYEGFVTHNF